MVPGPSLKWPCAPGASGAAVSLEQWSVLRAELRKAVSP